MFSKTVTISFVNEIPLLCIGYGECAFVFCLALALVAAQGFDRTIPKTEHVVSPQPWEYMSNEELPKEYDPYASFLFHDV